MHVARRTQIGQEGLRAMHHAPEIDAHDQRLPLLTLPLSLFNCEILDAARGRTGSPAAFNASPVRTHSAVGTGIHQWRNGTGVLVFGPNFFL